MSPSARRLVVPALLAAWLGLAGPAWAVFPPPIKDEGKFFSAEALDKANKKIREIYEHYLKDVVIETFPAIPADLEGKYKEQGKEKFFTEWARQRMKDLGVNGIYILICKKPGRLEVEVQDETRKKAFIPGDRDKLVTKMLARFREMKFDEGLLEGVEFIDSTLKANAGK